MLRGFYVSMNAEISTFSKASDTKFDIKVAEHHMQIKLALNVECHALKSIITLYTQYLSNVWNTEHSSLSYSWLWYMEFDLLINTQVNLNCVITFLQCSTCNFCLVKQSF